MTSLSEHGAFLVSTSVLAVASLSAQVAWTQVATTVAPAPRSGHRMVYDQHRQRIVLFGGYNGQQYFSDTWEWDGASWQQRVPMLSPPARDAYGMAYDPIRRRVVVFGGIGGTSFNDTWEYDGTTWQLRTPATSPSRRWAVGMTFDMARGVVLMQGGAGGGGIPETWEYDGTTWTQRFPVNNPRREEHAIAFDSRRDRVILFGGRDGGTFFTETLEWDGGNWLLLPTATHPPSRERHSLTYDPYRQRTVLFGGQPPWLDDTWEWDGTSWRQRAPAVAPSPRDAHAVEFDPLRGELLLFGGRDASGYLADTWRYAPTNPASYTALGTGCAGTAGAPSLAPMTGHLPWLGDNVTMEVRNLPPTAPVTYLIGDSNRAWGTLSLPFDLSTIGMNGCVLRAAGVVALPVPNQAGTASVSFAIPNLRFLTRAPLYDQAFVLDPPANPFGATLSNAGQWRFGER